MKNSLLLLAGLLSNFAQSQTFEYLDINKVKTRVNSGGDLHWDPATGNSSYECPIGSNKKYGGPASLWIGGTDAGGQLKLAGQTYHQSGVDFYAGPLNLTSATTTSATVNQYNRVWKLNKSDIDAFISNYANGNVQNGSYIPVADLLSWPGNGDISQNQDALIAPFKDLNGDMIYDPLGAGEYPLIKGDQTIFTVFNDNYLPHQSSGGAAIGLEIRLMAYAYGPCSVTAANPFLNYTTFYDYKIINRTNTALNNVYTGLFNDLNIGNYTDDYVGCDVQDQYVYTYNSPSAPVNQPAIGIVQLHGPYNMTNGMDDDGDGMTDEPFEQMRPTNFMYFNSSLPGVPLSQTDPGVAAEYYQYLKSVWKDGSPLTCGANGYGGSPATNFAYPGNTFANGPCGTSSWAETGTGSDKKSVMASGPYLLQPGAVEEVEYAYITAFDSITNNPLAKLDAHVQSLHAIYNSTLNQCLTTGMKEQHLNSGLNIFPNPTSGLLTINSTKLNKEVTIQVLDALGKVLLSQDYKEFSTTTLTTDLLPPGIYVIKLVSGEQVATKKFVKE